MQRGVKVEEVQRATRLRQAARHRGRHVPDVGLRRRGVSSDIEATIEHVKTTDPDIFFTTVAYPIKNTGYYEKVKPQAASSIGDWNTGSRPRPQDPRPPLEAATTRTPTSGCSTRSTRTASSGTDPAAAAAEGRRRRGRAAGVAAGGRRGRGLTLQPEPVPSSRGRVAVRATRRRLRRHVHRHRRSAARCVRPCGAASTRCSRTATARARAELRHRRRCAGLGARGVHGHRHRRCARAWSTSPAPVAWTRHALPTPRTSTAVADDRGPFDGALSNFGGLNCVDDLGVRRLRPGLGGAARGVALLCVMGPVVPWEWGWFLLPRAGRARRCAGCAPAPSGAA